MRNIRQSKKILYIILVTAIFLTGCVTSLDWPESPIYGDDIMNHPLENDSLTREEALDLITGHYAHFDVVSYEDPTTETPMNTFVISYGFTDFFLEDGKLMERETFLRAEHKINQTSVSSRFSDKAVQKIEPRVQEVELIQENGEWIVYRPPTPFLLGITGNPDLPLSTDKADPRIVDSDEDGKPGVTVEITIMGLIKGEIYITRREIYSNVLTLQDDGSLKGYVIDESEQFVIDATMAILKQPSNSRQITDPGMNPVLLIPIDESIDTLEELMEIRDMIFPESPDFIEMQN